ncbi:MAG: glutamate--cysteine ligase [Rickettsiales bacterium]|nr:glutamate--cysteine ligase [Rickettsiales bacterium]OUV53256.1 MAG: glutamate--cysteine ligase [Rickettsiales bacterium TMED127]|tara:strand:+ start:33968 stop:35305 length:1338 start_codon:yes stop_codon:yes gene_type:complete
MNKKIIKEDLINYFKSGCKEKKNWKIGTEHEKFGYLVDDLKPIKYDVIKNIFLELNKKFGWKNIYENDFVIGMKKSGSSISLEPGGQIELSGAPLSNIFDTCSEVNTHQFELNSVSKMFGVNYMGMGFNPKWALEHFPTIPKKRYEIMKNYMKKTGEHGLDMMFRTCTIQVNFDYESEIDMIKKYRVCLAIQPAVIALYANSPFLEGKLSSHLSYRSWIWTKTDKNRCGILPFVFDDGFSFEMYVDYLLDVPMYFLKRNNDYIDYTGKSFRKILELHNSNDGESLTIDDWIDHATTVFPEVRLKKILEVRGADGGPWSSVCALPAFWTGILYDRDILDEVYEMVKKWTNIQRKEFYSTVSLNALNSMTPDGEDIKSFLKKMLILSKKGLIKRNILNDNGENESIFLNPLFQILKNGQSPAEVWKHLFLNKWNKKIDNIYKFNSFG